MPASPESYEVPFGRVFVAGGYETRPILGAIGHSKVNYEITPGGGYGMYRYAHHKMMNALLRKPFDYVRLTVPASTMGPAWSTSDLVNGFYGRGGAGAADILGNTPPGVATYIDQIEELIGTRRALICIEAESNTLYGGTSAASGHACWDTYEDMIALFQAKGWKVAVSEPCPSVYYDTAGDNAAAQAFADDCIAADAAGTVTNLTGMWNSFHDPAAANGYLQPLSGYTIDGAHLGFHGALKRALAFADAFPAGLYAPWRPRSADVVCSQNPTLSGTGGTRGTNGSGDVPNGFTLSWAGTSRNVTGTQTDDGYELLFVYSGSSYAETTTTDLAAVSYIANVTPGVTEIEGICDVEILEAENMACTLVVNTGAGDVPSPSITSSLDDGYINWTSWVVGRRMVLHTDPFIAPSGMTRASASLRAQVKVFANTARLRVRVRWLGIKRTG